MFKLLFAVFFCYLFSVDTTSIYSIPVRLTDTSSLDLNSFGGKKILFVNTASNSVYVSQYSRLEQLYQKYKDSLVIIALPSNSFGNEPENDSIISSFVNGNYRITFSLAVKGDVSGNNIQPIYDWLENEGQNGALSSSVKDDFQKYLVNGSGNLIGVYASAVDPLDSQITDEIEGK